MNEKLDGRFQLLKFVIHFVLCFNTATHHQYQRWIHFPQRRSEALKTIDGSLDYRPSLPGERRLIKPRVCAWRILESILSNRSPSIDEGFEGDPLSKYRLAKRQHGCKKLPTMMSEPQSAKALLLPADGSKIRIVDYDIKEKDEGDVVDSGMADFYDPIPDLKSWFRDAYQERAMASFYVDTKRGRYCDPINRVFIKSEDSATWGQYCLYYTLLPTMPTNESCRRIIGSVSSSQLFCRGNVVVVRYEGHLGLGHVYKDVEEAAMKAVEKVLRKAYKSHGLERVHEENGSLPLLAS